MEREEKDSSETGSLGNNSSESPPMTTAAAAAAAGVLPQVMNASMERSVAPVQPTGSVASGGGDVTTGKKKRGRPRKYDENGNLRPQYRIAPPPPPPGHGGAVQTPPGFSFSSPSSGEFASSKKGRGRPGGTRNWQLLASLGELFVNTAGADFTPHVVTVPTGQDVAGKILSLAQRGPRGICILSANGTISNVTIRQPGSSGGLLTYEGLFEILSLTGSFATSESMKSRAGGLSVSLAGADGRVVGGGVAGVLLAASPIQIVIGSFMPNGYKAQKRKHHAEPRMAPVAQSAPDTATTAIPISQEALHYNLLPTLTSPLPVQSHGEVNNNTSSKDNPNTSSTNRGEYTTSEPNVDQRTSPDINVSIF